MTQGEYRYDVAISFAGEDRTIAEALAHALKDRGVRVFYDQFQKGVLWGKDLVEHLAAVYGKESRYCIVIISQHYPIKKWTKYELKWVQDRQLKHPNEYLLPLRVDGTEIPGLPSSVAYLDLHEETLETVCEAVIEKLRLDARMGENQENAPVSVPSKASLIKIDDFALSEIAAMPHQIHPFKKIQTAHDNTSGSYLSFNGGKRIRRLWANMHVHKRHPQWQQSERFYEPDANSSSISGNVSAWINVDKVWVRCGEGKDATPLTLPTKDRFTNVAVLRKPPRIAAATQNRLYLIDYENHEVLSDCEVPNSYTNSFDNMWFSEQGYLVTGKYASQVIWDNSDLETLFYLYDYGITAHYVLGANAYDRTGKFFSCFGMPNTLVVIDTEQRRIVANTVIPKNKSAFRSDLAFHPEYSNFLFCVNGGGEILCLNAISNWTRVLAREKRAWHTCFFPNVNILTTIDEKGICTNWSIEFIT